MLLALDARVHLAGPDGDRVLPLASFIVDYRRSALEPGELIVSIDIPKPFPMFSRFYKVAKRRMDDISTVAAGFSVDLDSSGRITRARFALGGVAAVPLRVRAAEESMLGERWNETTVERVQSVLESTLHPIGDHRGSAQYRRAVAKSLVSKFCWEITEAAA
jgi:xanthine dehydrogenase small subunit